MLLPRIELPTSKAVDGCQHLKLIPLLDDVVTTGDGTMVSIITEKLRTQTLEESLQFAPIPQVRSLHLYLRYAVFAPVPQVSGLHLYWCWESPLKTVVD